ncbi:MAG: hypothetical protein IT303_17585 [Dehalococcoidia bacterium]|nr:hypothetical protein [Dehalococcoidia bacterium]
MLDASYAGLRNTMASDANAVRELDAEYATSHAWIASGCPPHPTLGFYPNGIGEGGTWRLMEHQAFGITSMTWEAPTEAPSP